MQGKLSPKAKRIILIALVVLLAGFLIYTLIKQQKEEGTDPGGETVTLELADASDNDPSDSQSKTADESEELPFEGTELPPQTDPPDLYGPTLPPQTDPPGFWDDLTATETAAPGNETLPPQTDPPETLPPQTDPPETVQPTGPSGITVTQNGTYTDKDHVALYIHTYGHLPSNYITKTRADSIGNWREQGYYIGGDKFGNREGLLPKKNGRQYYECDISYTNNKYRGERRIVYSNDGLIYYTDDHYESFTRLY